MPRGARFFSGPAPLNGTAEPLDYKSMHLAVYPVYWQNGQRGADRLHSEVFTSCGAADHPISLHSVGTLLDDPQPSSFCEGCIGCVDSPEACCNCLKSFDSDVCTRFPNSTLLSVQRAKKNKYNFTANPVCSFDCFIEHTLGFKPEALSKEAIQREREERVRANIGDEAFVRMNALTHESFLRRLLRRPDVE